MRSSAPVASRSPCLVLYTSRYCGYCYRVLVVIKRLALTAEQIEVIDVTKAPERRDDIVRATGRRTVPVLRIPSYGAASPDGSPVRDRSTDRWLFESRDIVRYLHSRFDQEFAG